MSADVASTLATWSSTDASNSPSGSTSVSTNLDDNLRALQGVVVRGLSHKGADIASAATTDLGAIEGLAHDITGSATITSYGTVRAGIWKILKYEGAAVLTHNATSLILLGGANRTTANGDTQVVISEGSGNWREIAYFPVGSSPLYSATKLSAFAATTSAELAGVISDETGSGALVFASSPTLASPALGTPTSGNLANCTGLTEGGLNSSIVSQGKLKTTFGDVSIGGVADQVITLPGGEYGFYPQVWCDNPVAPIYATIAGINGVAGGSNSTSPITVINLTHNTGSGNGNARQRYIQASPPYDLGDGEVPLFVFALLDSAGSIMAMYSAEDPPWANNGPTDIRHDFVGANGRKYQLRRRRLDRAALLDPARRDAELEKMYLAPEVIEVDQALKQSDMPVVPHPFCGNLAGKTVVLLDPVCPLVERLSRMQAAGEFVLELAYKDYIRIGNVPLSRAAPPGVMPVAVNWRHAAKRDADLRQLEMAT
jgi:hypothetical protein